MSQIYEQSHVIKFSETAEHIPEIAVLYAIFKL